MQIQRNVSSSFFQISDSILQNESDEKTRRGWEERIKRRKRRDFEFSRIVINVIIEEMARSLLQIRFSQKMLFEISFSKYLMIRLPLVEQKGNEGMEERKERERRAKRFE